MKREFGKKLIEEFFPRVDLTHVIDTSGAYIPGTRHADRDSLRPQSEARSTSTFERSWAFVESRATPEDPAQGLVWSAIVEAGGHPGSQSEFVSVGDSPRALFHKHPWSIGGGGAAELKERLEQAAAWQLSRHRRDRSGSCCHSAMTMYSVCPKQRLSQTRGSRPVNSSSNGSRANMSGIGDSSVLTWLYFRTIR